jgi:hypothetical protein
VSAQSLFQADRMAKQLKLKPDAICRRITTVKPGLQFFIYTPEHSQELNSLG